MKRKKRSRKRHKKMERICSYLRHRPKGRYSEILESRVTESPTSARTEASARSPMAPTSAFFTALNDGITSAKISLSRMFIFQISAVLLLPLAIGLDGIWLAMPASEVCCCILSAHYYRLYSNRTGRINTSAISENSMPDMVPTAKSNQKTS